MATPSLRILLAVLCLASICFASPPKRRNAKPNFVVILTDDQDLLLDSLDHMPLLQEYLVQHGVTFNKHYGHVSLCCPARATIWTGKHAHNTNVTSVDNALPGGAWKQVQRNGWYKDYLPVWMQEAGYSTYYAGKIFNGLASHNYCDPVCMKGWTMGDFLVGPRVYAYYDSNYVHVEGDTWAKPRKISGYSTDIIADLTLSYIDDAAKSGSPFLAIAGPIGPHISGGVSYHDLGLVADKHNHTHFPYPIPKREYMDTFNDVQLPKTANFNPANRTGVAGIWKLDQLTDANVGYLDNYYRLRTQTLKSVDDMVEAVVQKLVETDLIDNTYIIYTSDNGFHLGNHRLQPGKEQCFEEDINLPFIIRGPGVAKGESTNLVTGHIDIAPTILQLAGLSLDHKLDGAPISFPLETHADFARNFAERGEHAHLEFWGPFKQEGMQRKLGEDYRVNLQTYKALRLQGQGYNVMYSVWCQEAAHELYDMTWDSQQMTNLHPNAPVNESFGMNAYQMGMNELLGRPITQVINRLDAFVLVEKTCVGVVCREPWEQLLPNRNVTTLLQALDEQYDGFFENSYQVAKVGWETCYWGYTKNHSATLYSLPNEEPNWINASVAKAVLSSAGHLDPPCVGWRCALALLFYASLSCIV